MKEISNTHKHMYVPVCNVFDPGYKLILWNISIIAPIDLIHYDARGKERREGGKTEVIVLFNKPKLLTMSKKGVYSILRLHFPSSFICALLHFS